MNTDMHDQFLEFCKNGDLHGLQSQSSDWDLDYETMVMGRALAIGGNHRNILAMIDSIKHEQDQKDFDECSRTIRRTQILKAKYAQEIE